jgi:hypothetical protein
MTLKEWSCGTGILPTHPTTERGAVSVLSTRESNPGHTDLWRLDDYAVSSVCGVVVWLVPRRDPSPWRKS